MKQATSEQQHAQYLKPSSNHQLHFPGASHHDSGRTQETGASSLQAGGDWPDLLYLRGEFNCRTWRFPWSIMLRVWKKEPISQSHCRVQLHLHSPLACLKWKVGQGWLVQLSGRSHWIAWRSLWRMMACHLGFPWTTNSGSWASLVPHRMCSLPECSW